MAIGGAAGTQNHPMSHTKIVLLTLLSMLAFAANSLLCRAALGSGVIDAASFAGLRMVSGAITLLLIVRLRGGRRGVGGSWWSALALFAYAATFAFAYARLTTATGALLLFGAVQATMIGYGLWKGERLHGWQTVGLVVAVGGLIGLLLPGLSAPPLTGSVLMLIAGACWGVYTLRGKGSGDPLGVTAGNFTRAVVFAAVLSVATLQQAALQGVGVFYAVVSGALASGLGYVIWYAVLPGLKTVTAATVQLSVPLLATVGGAVLLGEAPTLRVLLASIAILGGIALVILCKAPVERTA